MHKTQISKKLFLILIITSFSFIRCSNPSKNTLLDMNNVLMPSFEEIEYKRNSADTVKILILGNSITSHGVAKDIGWTHKGGMAASSSDKDYVHLLFSEVSKINPDKYILFRYANYASLERSNDNLDISDPKLLELYKFKPKFLIYQLGDNVTESNSETFKNNSINILMKFKDSKTLVVSPFFENKLNLKITKEIIKATKSKFIDIGPISRNEKFRANSDSSLNKKEWKVKGIGLHPGNNGMYQISKKLLAEINRVNYQQ